MKRRRAWGHAAGNALANSDGTAVFAGLPGGTSWIRTLQFAFRSVRRDIGENLDVYVLEALECETQVGWRGNVLGQEIVALVKSQVALLRRARGNECGFEPRPGR